ncbi:helix-turn-helix domain-containing protein [Magnetospirillum moscoviense]|uniref:Transcriptional regulator n=1 Tax=Magnetospirillum moscoviense TaxID=1437059 RepID=A0A178MIB9_9PROT|nr:transcriptional regulator [Magnetospirillum moscoviense]OAN48416.1 transcriptional regulator [Magnetospirillum moscoviense]
MGKFADELKASMREALAHAEGQPGTTTEHVVMVPDDVDVEAIRKGLGLTRPAFCRRFGLDVRAVQDWEQKRRRPDRAARAYLTVIANNPQAVEAALSAA